MVLHFESVMSRSVSGPSERAKGTLPPRQRPAAQLPVPAGAPAEGVLRRPAAAGAVPWAALGRPRLAAEPTGPYEEGNTRARRAKRQWSRWVIFAFPYVATVASLGLATIRIARCMQMCILLPGTPGL